MIYEQPALETDRLILEPVVEAHAEELHQLLSDPSLHRYADSEPMTLAEHRERCALWVTGTAPERTGLWLNWAARHREKGNVIAHFQATVKDNAASVGYTVAADHQRHGFALEAMRAILAYLRDGLAVHEVKAWIDSRNEPSQGLAKALGMVHVDVISGANVFEDGTSDNYEFELRFD